MSHVKQPRATASEDLSTQKKETYTKISIDKWKAICLLRVIYVPMQAHTHTYLFFFYIFRFLFLYFSNEVHGTYLHQWINNTNIRACIKHFVVVSLPVYQFQLIELFVLLKRITNRNSFLCIFNQLVAKSVCKMFSNKFMLTFKSKLVILKIAFYVYILIYGII